MTTPTLPTGQVKWRVYAPGADQVRVTFVPSAPILHMTDATDPYTAVVEHGTMTTLDGNTLIPLPATDGDPAGWTWTAHLRIDGALMLSVPFELPAGTVVDLAAVVPVSESAGVRVLQGPPGPVGPVGPPGPTGYMPATDADREALIPSRLSEAALRASSVSVFRDTQATDRADSPLRYITTAPELVTDWQPALTAAMGSGGKQIDLPPLTMNIASRAVTTDKNCLIVPTRTRIVGSGWASIIRAADTLPADRVIWHHENVTDILHANYQIDGNIARIPGGTNPGTEDEIMHGRGLVQRLTFDNLWIHHAGADAFDFDSTGFDAHDMRITNVLVEDCGGNVLHNGIPKMIVSGLVARRNTFRRGQGGITNPWTINLNFADQWITNSIIEDNWGGVKFNLVATGGRRGITDSVIRNPESEEGIANTGGATDVLISRCRVEMKPASTKGAISATGSQILDNTVYGATGQPCITNTGGVARGNRTYGGSLGVYSAGSAAFTHITHDNNIARDAATANHRVGGSATLTGSLCGNHAFGSATAFDIQSAAASAKLVIAGNDPHGGAVALVAPGPHVVGVNAGRFNTGTTSERSSMNPARRSPESSAYFDKTLGKPLWSDGTVWRDATGVAV